jgi:formylglycine-generating enzyme required for sulfatase activity
MKFAWIPAGTFLMGSPENEEEHEFTAILTYGDQRAKMPGMMSLKQGRPVSERTGPIVPDQVSDSWWRLKDLLWFPGAEQRDDGTWR